MKRISATLPIAARLALAGLKYRFHRFSGSPAAVEALSIEITHRCIARCLMCNIWKIPASVPDLSLGDWLGFLERPVFARLKELDVTGGEPFLREDVVSLMEGVSVLKMKGLSDLRSVALTTNGFLTEKILTGVDRMAPVMKNAGLDLVLVLAMDGIGAVHERIRNVKNGWTKLSATLDGLIEMRRKWENIIIGLKTTILPLNVAELDGIARFAAERNFFTIISPCIITKGRYGNEDLSESLRFDDEALETMVRFYEGPSFRWSYHRLGLLELLKKGSLRKPCSAGFNYYFVRSTGDVFSCPLIPRRLGNFTEQPMEELVRGRPAKEFRQQIGTFSECRFCTEPGLERYALPFEGFSYLKLLLSLGREDFLAFHRHMGLDKYV